MSSRMHSKRSSIARSRRCRYDRNSEWRTRNATTTAATPSDIMRRVLSPMAVLMSIILLSAIPAIEGLVPPLLDAAAATVTSAGRKRHQHSSHHRLGSTKQHAFQPEPNADIGDASSASCRCQSPPVIGVFSQPVKARGIDGAANATAQSAPLHYIAASYIKWLEAGGARAVAIPYDASDDVLDELFGQIHMVFLPGGDAVLSPAISYMLNKVHESNHGGNAFPVWGTCLGMELLLIHFGQGGEPLVENYDAENMSLPLLNVVVPDSQQQSKFKRANPRDEYEPFADDSTHYRSLYDDPAVYRIATTQSVTLNNHKKGMSPERFLINQNLTDLWQITSTNVDRQNQSFVSTIEPIEPEKYPYYGVQYHPEKNMFEYAFYDGTTVPYEVIAHSPDAIEFSYRMARYAVSLAQRSRRLRCIRRSHDGTKRQQQTDESQLSSPDDQSLYRHEYVDPRKFPPMYTYPTRSGINFEQVYLIPPASSRTSTPSAVVEGLAATATAGPQDRGLPDVRSVMQW
jgi:gamma-glutamyl hydrolase